MNLMAYVIGLILIGANFGFGWFGVALVTTALWEDLIDAVKGSQK